MILVIGANGMLGHDLMQVLAGDVRGIDLPDIDITSLESVRRVLLTLKPKVVINSAAYTDVDGCETNVEQAMAVNGEGVGLLAMTAREIGAARPLKYLRRVEAGRRTQCRHGAGASDCPHPVALRNSWQELRRNHASAGKREKRAGGGG